MTKISLFFSFKKIKESRKKRFNPSKMILQAMWNIQIVLSEEERGLRISNLEIQEMEVKMAEVECEIILQTLEMQRVN